MLRACRVFMCVRVHLRVFLVLKGQGGGRHQEGAQEAAQADHRSEERPRQLAEQARVSVSVGDTLAARE